MSSALMSIGKTAMSASYASLQTVGNNIANANTPGYSRQETQLADAPGQFTGSGFFGKGVTVTTVQRAYNAYLTNQAVGTSSTAAADTARLDKLTQLESVFPLGDAGLGAKAGAFLNSFVDLSNAPSDSSARQVVLSQAQSLASQFAAAGDQLSALQTGVTQDVKVSVASLNSMAQQVAALNKQIAELQGTGQPPNQLLDQRDQLVSQIAGIVNVTTIAADDGSVGVFIGGGQSLVLGANANTLKAVPDAFDPAKVSLAIAEGGTSRLIPPSSLAGGSLSGLLKFQNQDLTSATNLLGQMATAVAGAVNGRQALGLDLGQPPGAGAPIFSVGAPRVLAAAANAGTAALSVSVSDASQVLPTDFSVAFDGSNYVVTRSDNKSAVAGSPFTPAQLAAGVQFNGVSLKLTGGSAVSADRFLLQPVATAASNMQTVLASTQGLAAAAPFTASTGAANTGSATIASLAAVGPAYNGTLSAAITFTSNGGAYNWSLSDGSNGTGSWTAGQPIALNGFELNLAGVPKLGDQLSVQPTTDVASNNGNALAFANLANGGVVAAGDGTSAQTITDAYASAIANIGVRVQGGRTASQISSAAASQAEAARADKAGVNLDEEAAKLIQYQQSYQAAAKILQIAQQIFDTMLQTAAG
ncbi:MAG TPA: flagellar hook-associated protein FlgK [Burkholderiaceae bacterium]|nr:flagellar hook-associated protein FlgK [Burkholderiaceae bacterium]